MKARTTEQMTLTGGLWAYITIMAKEPEEKATTAMMMAACVTGSVFISKANFICGASGDGGEVGKGSRKRVCEGARSRERKEPGIITTTEVRAMESPWFISVGKNSCEEVSVSFRLRSRTTDRLTSIVPCVDDDRSRGMRTTLFTPPCVDFTLSSRD